jgi:hypothetical protein
MPARVQQYLQDDSNLDIVPATSSSGAAGGTGESVPSSRADHRQAARSRHITALVRGRCVVADEPPVHSAAFDGGQAQHPGLWVR